jgi:hypothetical protein
VTFEDGRTDKIRADLQIRNAKTTGSFPVRDSSKMIKKEVSKYAPN